MKTPFGSKPRIGSRGFLASTVLVLALALAGCAGIPVDLSQLPFVSQFLAPTPTFTPTPVPTPTPTPEPTNTPRPGETPEPPTPTPIPTPQVTIPQGFTPVLDEERGYSLAVPAGWSALDLRSPQFQNLANTFGMGAQLGPLNDFLASPEGEALGVIYVTDLMNAMFGGLPTALNVFVIDAPGVTPDSLLEWLQGLLEANAAMLGDVEIRDMNTAVINNIPGVRGSAVADLSSYGVNAQVFAKVVGLIANDKVYVLTLATQANNQAAKEPVFDQIIGTFRPE
ncbi:MAG TPA: hypothetical protein VNK95_12050 [Caldilineaceae bacterium]|nr:hypothetical protein [Caldilineaceae bacterium]